MALREIIARFGFSLDQKGIKKAETGINGVVSKLKGLGVALSAGIVARGIKNFVTGMVDAGDSLGKTATQLGLSSDQLQAWQAAAGFAGVEAAKFSQSIRVMQKNALLAEQGSKQAGDAFKKLGVDFKDSNGQLKAGDQLLREVGLALNANENSTERVALAQQLMGRTGAALLPLFKDGEKGLDRALAALERFGGGLSKDMVKAAEDAQDRFAELNIATSSFKSQIAIAILPAISQLVLAFSKLLAWFSKTVAGTEAITSAIVAFGLVLGKLAIAKFGGSLIALGKAAAIPLLKFILLALVVDDLIALFTGRASVIGTFIDKIFGKGSAQALVAAIKSVGSAFSSLIQGDFKTFDKKLEDIFGPPGEALVRGTVNMFVSMAAAIDKFIAESKKSIAGFFSAIGSFFSQIGSNIAAAGIAAAKGALQLGKDLVAGVVEGIKAAPGAVLNALGGVVTGALNAVKNKFKIDSPSRVFAEQLGAPLIQGIAMGAKNAAGPAQRVTQGAAAAAAAVSPRALSAAPRGGVGAGGVVFKSDIAIHVSGGAPNAQGVAQLRQGVRAELHDNRRATLEALQQLVPA